MLDDISGVKTWDKVNSGLLKMYKAEVLGKLPIMQHFLFGSLISFLGSEMMAGDVEHDQEPEHDHAAVTHVHAKGQEFPDCCSIRIPSAIGAAALEGNDGKPNVSTLRDPRTGLPVQTTPRFMYPFD